MRCQNVQEILDQYRTKGLDPGTAGEVETHLAACEDCRNALARIEGLAAVLRTVAVPPVPLGLTERIMVQARGRMAPQPAHVVRDRWEWLSRSFPMQTAAALAVVVGLAVGGLMARDTWDRPSMANVVSDAAAGGAADEYNLDYLTEAPAGSLVDAYMQLALAQ